MDAPPNFEEGQSTYRPLRFNGQYYGCWKTRMHNFIMAEDSELCDVICDGPFVPTKNLGDLAVAIPKKRMNSMTLIEWAYKRTFVQRKFLFVALVLMNTIRYQHVNQQKKSRRLFKELTWEQQVKQSKIDMLTTEYKLFRMKDNESIQDMHTRFTSIINELHSLGEIISRNKLVSKILSVLLSSWESKVNAITEAKDLQTLTMDELVGNLKTYEMKKKKDNERREPKRKKILILKMDCNDSSGKDGDMAYLTRRFQKMQDQYNNNFNKAAKRNPVPDKHFKRKYDADDIVKQALAVWGDSSSESEDENDHGVSSMLVVENKETEYDSIFALMDQSDDEDDDDDEVNFLDVKRNVKSYSPKKLMSLENVLIDAYHSLINDKDALIVELGEAKQSRDDLVVVAVDLRETIENLKKEKDALDEKIANVE
ncbi:uncharacterized protein [Nicotiana sylvestris]|uniref:uncharacterized protein n=1 Tax=Nicotiana sylvestris TaxID=4096 RepID=UPI00388CAF10